MSELLRVGEQGVVVPKELTEKLRLKEGDTLLADANPDGSITLRPVTGSPIREYTGSDLKTFADEDRLSPGLAARTEAFLKE